MTARTILCDALLAVCPPRGNLFFVISSSPDEVSCSSSVVDAGAFLYPLVGGGDLYSPNSGRALSLLRPTVPVANQTLDVLPACPLVVQRVDQGQPGALGQLCSGKSSEGAE